MQTIAAFIAATNGKPQDLDGVYGPQCMDLAERFARDVINSVRLGGNAIDVAHKGIPGYVWVANQPENYPMRGDLVVWGPNLSQGIGEYGHIAIALVADQRTLVTYDQNFPEGSPPHMWVHSYAGVLGWQHPIRLPS